MPLAGNKARRLCSCCDRDDTSFKAKKLETLTVAFDKVGFHMTLLMCVAKRTKVAIFDVSLAEFPVTAVRRPNG